MRIDGKGSNSRTGRLTVGLERRPEQVRRALAEQRARLEDGRRVRVLTRVETVVEVVAAVAAGDAVVELALDVVEPRRKRVRVVDVVVQAGEHLVGLRLALERAQRAEPAPVLVVQDVDDLLNLGLGAVELV